MPTKPKAAAATETITFSDREIVFKGQSKPKQLVYCVVLEPDTEDLQQDVISKEEIEASAHGYLRESRVIGKNHSSVADAEVVESFIAPVDFLPEGATEVVTKGSWVMVIKVNDVGLWQNIEDGDITGLSIGGTGYRSEVEPGET